MRKTALYAAALAVAVVVVGCGGSDGSGGSIGEGSGEPISTSSLSKPQWIKQADALCVENYENQMTQLTAYAEEHSDENEEERLEGAVNDVYAPAMEERLAKFRKLGAPKGDEKEVERILVAIEDMVAAAQETGASSGFFAKQSTKYRAVEEGYGLKECDT